MKNLSLLILAFWSVFCSSSQAVGERMQTVVANEYIRVFARNI